MTNRKWNRYASITILSFSPSFYRRLFTLLQTTYIQNVNQNPIAFVDSIEHCIFAIVFIQYHLKRKIFVNSKQTKRAKDTTDCSLSLSLSLNSEVSIWDNFRLFFFVIFSHFNCIIWFDLHCLLMQLIRCRAYLTMTYDKNGFVLSTLYPCNVLKPFSPIIILIPKVTFG